MFLQKKDTRCTVRVCFVKRLAWWSRVGATSARLVGCPHNRSSIKDLASSQQYRTSQPDPRTVPLTVTSQARAVGSRIDAANCRVWYGLRTTDRQASRALQPAATELHERSRLSTAHTCPCQNDDTFENNEHRRGVETYSDK